MGDENSRNGKGKRGVGHRSLDAKIEDQKAKLKRLEEQKRKRETTEKIVTGAIVIESAMQDEPTRDWLLTQLKSQTTDRDKDRISALLERLQQADFPELEKGTTVRDEDKYEDS